MTAAACSDEVLTVRKGYSEVDLMELFVFSVACRESCTGLKISLLDVLARYRDGGASELDPIAAFFEALRDEEAYLSRNVANGPLPQV